MLKNRVLVLCLLICSLGFAHAQVNKIVGVWKTIDDSDGSAKSLVHIFKATNGKYYGKIEKLFKDPSLLCVECEDALKNKPVLGMLIINGMKQDGNDLTGGTILDPKTGKLYYCSISYDSKKDQLKLRGSLDKSGLFGRTQTWIREK